MADNESQAAAVDNSSPMEAVASTTLDTIVSQEVKKSEVQNIEVLYPSKETEVASSPPVGEPSQAVVTYEVPKPIGFIYALYLSIFNFYKPLYDRLKASHPTVEAVVVYCESVVKSLEKFFSQFESIWDIKWSDLKELIEAGWKEVASFFSGENNPLNLAFKLWYRTHVIVKESIKGIERIHEYIIPSIEGDEPLYDIEKMDIEETSIRMLCLYVNMNLAHRIFVHVRTFSYYMLDYCFQAEKPLAADVSCQISTVESVSNGSDLTTNEEFRKC